MPLRQQEWCPMQIKTFAIALIAGVAFTTAALAADDLRGKATDAFKALPSTIPSVKDNPDHAEENLSRQGAVLRYAHVEIRRLQPATPVTTWQRVVMTNLETSIGHGWQKGPRNAPTALNAVLNEAQFWDGRAEDLKAQAKGPVQAGVEMANTADQVVATLKSMPAYGEAFKAAFPQEKGSGDLRQLRQSHRSLRSHADHAGTVRLIPQW